MRGCRTHRSLNVQSEGWPERIVLFGTIRAGTRAPTITLDFSFKEIRCIFLTTEGINCGESLCSVSWLPKK